MVVAEQLILLDTNVVLYYLGNRLIDPLPIGKYTDVISWVLQ
jgi:hypothetical protein